MLDINDLTVQLKEICLKQRKKNQILLSARKKDISLSVDKVFHKKIIALLKSRSAFPILSEETRYQRDFSEYDDYFWIIDPLDGSFNYYRLIPMFCVSIALWKRGQPVLGIIYDFTHDEIFIGVNEKSEISKEAGAWLNSNSITASKIKNRNQGVICTGFPSFRDYDTHSLGKFVKKVQVWKKVRLIGSAALSLAWVGCGRVDAYIEEDIRIWDVAAGLAIVKAAGGEIYFKVKNRKNFIDVGATNGHISVKELME